MLGQMCLCVWAVFHVAAWNRVLVQAPIAQLWLQNNSKYVKTHFLCKSSVCAWPALEGRAWRVNSAVIFWVLGTCWTLLKIILFFWCFFVCLFVSFSLSLFLVGFLFCFFVFVVFQIFSGRVSESLFRELREKSGSLHKNHSDGAEVRTDPCAAPWGRSL